jgi:hypothetical protein
LRLVEGHARSCMALNKGSLENASNLLIFALTGLADYSHNADSKVSLEAPS